MCVTVSACGTYYTPQFAGTMQNISADKGDDVSFVCHIKHVGRNKVNNIKLVAELIENHTSSICRWRF